MDHHDSDTFEGKDLEEAIHAAAKGLGIPEGELHYEVLQQGRKGLLGLGTKNVRIRVMRPVEHLTDHEILSGAEPRRAKVVPPPVDAQPEGGQAKAGSERPKRPARRRRSRGPGKPAAAAPSDRSAESDRVGNTEPAAEPELVAGTDESKRPARPRRSRRSGRSRRARKGPAELEERFEDVVDDEDAAPPEPVEPLTGQPLEVQQTLEQILEMSKLELEVMPGAADEGVVLRLGGADRKLLKQRNAELLLALQFLLNRMARRAWPGVGRIRLTTNGDNQQRESQLIRLTRGAAKQVTKTGRTKKLRPMNAYERRLVHLTIREYAGLTSSSDGDGSLKRVRISKVKNELSV